MMRLIPILSACTLLLASATTQAADACEEEEDETTTEGEGEEVKENDSKTEAKKPAEPAAPAVEPGPRPYLVAVAGAPGETCLLLVDAKRGPANPLAKRCTYGLAWMASVSVNRCVGRTTDPVGRFMRPPRAWRD